MSVNYGKKFEEKFKGDWKKCFPSSFLLRLNDQITGYLTTSQNACDFISFTRKSLFLIECKSHDGASIPFSAIPQYERLLAYKDMEDVYPVIIIWFKEKDKVLGVPIHEAEKMVKNGEKSIGLRMLDKKSYNIIDIPSVKKRVFMDTDYKYLVEELLNDEHRSIK